MEAGEFHDNYVSACANGSNQPLSPPPLWAWEQSYFVLHYISPKVIGFFAYIDVANVACTVSYYILLWYMFVKILALRALSRCKHDVGALSWLSAETLKSTPQTSKVLRHGCSFERLVT